MKSLLLIRHAQAKETQTGQRDFDRELSPQGLRDSSHIGHYLRDEEILPDAIICSTAERARNTTHLLAEQLRFDTQKIKTNDDLYEASVRTFLHAINQLDDHWNTVIMVGHNPTLTYLGEYLTKQSIGNVVPAGVLHLTFTVDSWNEISEGTAMLKAYKHTFE
ncbi:histidine phosphatase family protein [Fulvivirgaceae bacterium BMA10]|uniref:Histidine phosphatase family protein n=1 Tax=Splendidivirga corallicola TaxID=3051826 RepID=A0ABT8KR58_9BACT|nr:histidine phosphatase family protein [Fulvivirgaceae bacterium BMA10]